MKIIFTTRFRRSYKRLVLKNAVIKKLVDERCVLFSADSKNILLKDHSLGGKLASYRAFSIGYDLRVMYRQEHNECIFFDIGTHDDLYR